MLASFAYARQLSALWYFPLKDVKPLPVRDQPDQRQERLRWSSAALDLACNWMITQAYLRTEPLAGENPDRTI